MSITVQTLVTKDISDLAAAFLPTVWKTQAAYFQQFIGMQEQGERVFLLARDNGKIAGFVTIRWQSGYPPFAEQGIPEINDLRVLEGFRRRGVGTALMDEAEMRIFERSPMAGLGVGLYADYGNAQRMYARRGYVPDGRVIFYRDRPVPPRNSVLVDDNLVLYMAKQRPKFFSP
jgi:ribosomal protein S18 acetylase RimI-like enzyme